MDINVPFYTINLIIRIYPVVFFDCEFVDGPLYSVDCKPVNLSRIYTSHLVGVEKKDVTFHFSVEQSKVIEVIILQAQKHHWAPSRHSDLSEQKVFRYS